MIRLFVTLVLIAGLIAGAVFFADRPGTVELVWQGTLIRTSVMVLVLGVILLAMVSALVFHILRKLIRGPGAFLRSRREHRRRQGYRALTQGMVAVAAGDAAEALKYARKADVLLAEPPLTLLLSAQAAQLNGDERAAQNYFAAMLERPETEFLGLRGLLTKALREGDEATALRLAERARALRPKTPWVLSTLFDLQTRAGRWDAAEETLEEASKRKALPGNDSKRRRAVLYHERSIRAEGEGLHREAQNYAAKAHSLDPGLVPAADHLAELQMAEGRTRQAAKTIENAWRHTPHPKLAATFGRIYADNPPLQRLKRFEKLADCAPDDPESQAAAASAAMEARLWGEARRHLEKAAARYEGLIPPPARICRLLAKLEEAEHKDETKAQDWLARASIAPADPTWVCDACGHETSEWSPVCSNCRAFATLSWRAPSRSTARTLPKLTIDTGPSLLSGAVDENGARDVRSGPSPGPA